MQSDTPAVEAVARALAKSLDETWIFAAMHAQGYSSWSNEPVPRIHPVHAALLARVHVAVTDAHKLGLLPAVNTSRLAEMLAEQGYDVAALSQAADGGEVA